jgi:glycosyltransferase involved in cell wall biosynthesis
VRICYFGAFDPSYARNNFLRDSLELAGCQIAICNVPLHWPTVRKIGPLIKQYQRVWRECDLIVVAEFCQTLVPLAWILGRLTGRPVVFDMLISMYQAVVFERRRYAPAHLRARQLYWLDQSAGRLADRLLVESRSYGQLLTETLGLPAGKMIVAPLGVNDRIFHPLPSDPSPSPERLAVLYFGSYVPNHGVDIILDAANHLRADHRLMFRLIGDGEAKQQAIDRASALKLTHVEFLPRVPFEMLPAQIAQAEIVLGVFGDTLQARQATANKVLQGLAMRKPVVTGDTLTTREYFSDREHLWLCPLGDSAALADALRTLADDAALRRRLAEQGYQRVKECLTPAVLGPQLAQALHSFLSNGQGPFYPPSH